MAPKRTLYSFSIDEDLKQGLQAFRKRYRYSEASQIRTGVRLWLSLSAEQKIELIEKAELRARGDGGGQMSRQFTTSAMVEDKSGVGVLRREGHGESTQVSYRVTVEREKLRAGDEWVDGLLEIEGKVDAEDEGFIFKAINGAWPLVLETDDGRIFECFVSDLGGRLVARTGNALRPKA